MPPLDPLIAFEAAARLLSFTRAGEELHLSQAAISQQIRSLEESLQVKLFTRSHRAVAINQRGARIPAHRGGDTETTRRRHHGHTECRVRPATGDRL